MSNIGIPMWVFSVLPRFLPHLMIFIIWINSSSFIGTIYIEKLSNLAQIWAEMKKPTLEFLRWTLEFQRGNSNVQRRNSKVGFFISAQIFSKFDDFYNLNEFVIIYWYNIHWKIIKFGKNLERNEKTHVGIPRLDIEIPT